MGAGDPTQVLMQAQHLRHLPGPGMFLEPNQSFQEVLTALLRDVAPLLLMNTRGMQSGHRPNGSMQAEYNPVTIQLETRGIREQTGSVRKCL